MATLLLPRRRQRSRDAAQPVRINGHRGHSHDFPENTIPALLAAAELGADGLEFDVQVTRDGQVVLMHDNTLKRTTDVREVFGDRAGDPVSMFTSAEIAALDAGAWKSPRFRGVPVPMLGDVMKAFEDRPIRMSVELKATRLPALQVARAVLAAVGERRDVTVMSFRRPLLEAVLQVRPEARVGLIAVGRPTVTDLATYDEFHLDQRVIGRSLVRRVHEAGASLTAWTVDTAAGARSLALEAGVDAITTNRVDVVREALGPR